MSKFVYINNEFVLNADLIKQIEIVGEVFVESVETEEECKGRESIKKDYPWNKYVSKKQYYYDVYEFLYTITLTNGEKIEMTFNTKSEMEQSFKRLMEQINNMRKEQNNE